MGEVSLGGWLELSPWCPLYRRAQGTRRQRTLYTVAEMTTGVLSHYFGCTIVTSAHCSHAVMSSCPCLVVLGQLFVTRYEPEGVPVPGDVGDRIYLGAEKKLRDRRVPVAAVSTQPRLQEYPEYRGLRSRSAADIDQGTHARASLSCWRCTASRTEAWPRGLLAR